MASTVRRDPARTARTPELSAARLLALLRRQWQVTSVAAMAVVGIGISAYLTTEHYAKVEPFCPTVGPINCGSVLRSTYSVVPLTGSPSSGIPITVPGGIWFFVSGALAVAMLVYAYRGEREPARLRPALLLWSLAGLLFVLYLVFAEIVLIRNICLWCTGVHILTLLTFLVALSLWQQGAAESRPVRAMARTGDRQPSRANTPARAASGRAAAPSRRARSRARR